jgi:hypothetical protein
MWLSIVLRGGLSSGRCYATIKIIGYVVSREETGTSIFDRGWRFASRAGKAFGKYRSGMAGK